MNINELGKWWKDRRKRECISAIRLSSDSMGRFNTSSGGSSMGNITEPLKPWRFPPPSSPLQSHRLFHPNGLFDLDAWMVLMCDHWGVYVCVCVCV